MGTVAPSGRYSPLRALRVADQRDIGVAEQRVLADDRLDARRHPCVGPDPGDDGDAVVLDLDIPDLADANAVHDDVRAGRRFMTLANSIEIS